MSGLEKITGKIILKAKEEAEKNISAAEEKAKSVISSGEKEIEDLTASYRENIGLECEKISQMGETSINQEKREILLKTKSESINEIINLAKDKMKKAPKDEYNIYLKKILISAADGKEGEIFLSKKAGEYLDDDLLEMIKSKNLSVSHTPADADSGFIIKYGNIEINCTFDSIFEEKFNQLTDSVNSYISLDKE